MTAGTGRMADSSGGARPGGKLNGSIKNGAFCLNEMAGIWEICSHSKMKGCNSLNFHDN